MSVLLFMAAVLVTLEKSAKGGMQKFFKYVPAVVLCYLIAMFLCTLGVWDMAETKPITFQSLILLLGSAFLVSAIATNVGNKLYALTNFSDKATWTVLFVTVVALIAAVTPRSPAPARSPTSCSTPSSACWPPARACSSSVRLPPGSPPASLSSASTRC